MTKKVTAAAIPPLRLSTDDERELRTLSAQLQREILSQYENFLFRDQRSIDATRWKHARSDGDVHAYKERHAKKKHQRRPSVEDDKHSYAYKPQKPSTPRPQQTLADQSTIPRVLVTGTIAGTLDDVMYGSTVHDTASLQAYWASQNDRFEESAVLATLDSPTIDDPFRFLGVIWFLRSFPLNLRQRRDLLTLTSSGTAQLSNGEYVGFDVAHSVQHRDLAELHEFNTIRAVSSILKVFRQLDEQRVEVFMIHFLDTKGCVPDCSNLQDSIRYMLPLASTACQAGFRKKLQWLIRQRAQDHLRATPCDAIEPQSSGTNDYCELCDKTLGTLLSCPGTSCELCYQRVCFRCSVSHELAEVGSSGSSKVALRAADFCLQCLLHARAVPTLSVAQDEALRRLNKRSSSRTTSSSSSSSGGSSSGSKHGRERVLTTLMSADAALECL